MSLLDEAKDTALVWPETQTVDGDGNPVRRPAATPVTVTGRARPLAATEDNTDGQSLGTTWVFLCRDFPAGPFARVEIDGRDWDVQGEPKRRDGSEATAHVTVVLRARDPVAVT